MPDVYNTITSAEPVLVDRIAQVLEVRAADPQQQSMLGSYLAEVTFPANARFLEVGCGTGPVCRRLADWPNVAQVTGVDPSSLFIEKASQLAAGLTNLSFQEGSANQLPFSDGDFDVAVFHTTLCHLSDPIGALQEAHRVLKPGGASGPAVNGAGPAMGVLGYVRRHLPPPQVCHAVPETNFQLHLVGAIGPRL